MIRTILKTAAAILLTATAISCGSGPGKDRDAENGAGTTQYARYLDILEHDGYTVVEVTNPWDTARLLHRYILVPQDSPVPSGTPEGTLIRTPIDRIIVYSSVHASILDALGASGRITGVCEPEYMTCPAVKEGIASGQITDCGNSVSPSIERIARAGGQVIIASPFENSGYGAAGKLGIPIIEAADYMENTPLGRTEWIRLFGALLDCQDRADSLFRAAEEEYNGIRNSIARHIDSDGSIRRPTLVAERKYGASWDVPGGASYMARIYTDAGADYIFSNTATTANINMSFESVLREGIDADIWVLKYWSPRPMTYSSLKDEYSLYSRFRAFQEHHVYGCNTCSSTYYDDIVLHPAWILEDLAAIFHPALFPDHSQRYFKPLQ